jgi:hypothetical protein
MSSRLNGDDEDLGVLGPEAAAPVAVSLLVQPGGGLARPGRARPPVKRSDETKYHSSAMPLRKAQAAPRSVSGGFKNFFLSF